MADVVDIGNEYAQAEIDKAIANHKELMRGQGRDECACGESISKLRKEWGATRCVECQDRYERRM
jgi:RNA polymerase-binding transcription factor DksA